MVIHDAVRVRRWFTVLLSVHVLEIVIDAWPYVRMLFN